MSAWDHGLYDNEAALDARGELLSGIGIPEDPAMFAACIGLLALLDPTADQLAIVKNHRALAELPAELHEAAAVAAMIGASGPCLPYRVPLRDILGISASYGRVVEPLLELRETIPLARAIRNRCIDIVGSGFAYGETASGGILGLLLELRELGVATSPALVDEWLTEFDVICATGNDAGENPEFLRGWCASYRAALELLAQPPDQKLLGSDPTRARRNTSGH